MMELKAQMRVKSSVISLFLALIVVFSIAPSTFSSLPPRIIPSNGIIGVPGVIASSGSPADIQAAVNTVNSAGGGTVYVPAGTFNWNGETVTIPGGVNVIGASYAGCKGHEDKWEEYTATTILHNNKDPTTVIPNMFVVNGNNGKATRISGIRFERHGPPSYAYEWNFDNRYCIELQGAKNFRIDHCTFIDFAGTSVISASASWYGVTEPTHSAYGLVDHCVIDLPYKLNPSSQGWEGGYGFYALGNMRDTSYVDDIKPFAGKYEAIRDTSIMYVEDCKMSKSRHAIDVYCGGAACVRYNLFEPFRYLTGSTSNGEIDMHGGFGTGDSGGVLLEAYNNTIMGKDGLGTLAYRIRGGHGLCYNNIFNPPYNSQNCLVTIDGEYNKVNQLWIWDNDYSNCIFINNKSGGKSVENVDYFLREPTQAQDGWTYTPYSYPHPIIAG